jgi:RNA polymerase sigma-70 factor, ECF subfamily
VREWSALLRAIATGKALDRLRRRATRRKIDQPITGESPSTASQAASTSLEQRELGARLTSAIARLPQREAEVFVLRHIEEMDYTQIARLLGLSESNVGTLLTRGRMRLRTWLADERPALPARRDT